MAELLALLMRAIVSTHTHGALIYSPQPVCASSRPARRKNWFPTVRSSREVLRFEAPS